MIDQMTKQELKDQLKANEIAIPVETDETILRDLLTKAIEEGKAELKDLGPVDEDQKPLENENDKGEQKEMLVTGVPGIDGEQMTTLQCMLFMQGKPFKDVKESEKENEKAKKTKSKK